MEYNLGIDQGKNKDKDRKIGIRLNRQMENKIDKDLLK